MDWNPNIITKFNEHAIQKLVDATYREPEKTQLASRLEILRTKYAQARKLAGSKAALALKLKLPAVKTQILPHHHLGGIPDLTANVTTSAFYAKHSYDEGKLAKMPSLDELVNRYWPKSPSGEPMKFLCSLNIYDWLKTIHYATGEYWGGKDDYKLFSAVGNRNVVQYENTLRIWFDPDFNDTYLSADSQILVVWENMFKDNPVYSEADINAAVNRKQIEAESVERATPYKIPFTHLGEPEIAFDLESKAGADYGWQGVSDSKGEKLWDHPLFSSDNAELTVLGRPSSQQTERRFINPFPGKPHRLTPFLHWHHAQSDITYQLYAATKTFQHDWIEGKIDASCT